MDYSHAYLRYVQESCSHARTLAERISAGHTESVLPEVREAWISTELPSQCVAAWTKIWSAVRKSPAGRSVMSPNEQDFLKGLPAQLTVYRGAGVGRERGWSWTLEREIAEDFARRYNHDPVVCATTVSSAEIIAYFDLGDEAEIILDPDSLDWANMDLASL